MSDSDTEDARIEFRRETHAVNRRLSDLLDRIDDPEDDDVATCIRRARSALFEAWTLLCTPPEEEEDD